MSSNMEEHVIRRSGERDLRFVGKLIAEAISSANNARSDYSGSTGRWTELRLYRTAGEQYVCERIGRTRWQGEHDRHTAVVCGSVVGVCEFFGSSWLAKQLYVDAGIDCVEDVD